jgi:RNA recognition motif-containing protein
VTRAEGGAPASEGAVVEVVPPVGQVMELSKEQATPPLGESNEKEEAPTPISPSPAEAAPTYQRDRAPASTDSSPPEARTIWVSNIPWNTTPDALSQLFSQCGEVARVRLVRDKAGHSKGFAYVEFVRQEAARAALGLTDLSLSGRPLLIQPAGRKAQLDASRSSSDTTLQPPDIHRPSGSQPQSPPQTQQEHLAEPQTEAEQSRAPKEAQAGQAARKAQRQEQDVAGQDSRKKRRAYSDSRTIFVSNLSFDTTEDDLRRLFGDCGPIKAIRLIKDRKQRSKGFAYVEWLDEEALVKALTRNQTVLSGRPINVVRSNPPRAAPPEPILSRVPATTLVPRVVKRTKLQLEAGLRAPPVPTSSTQTPNLSSE